MPGAVVGCRRNVLEELVVVGLDPVGQRAAEVHQRVADRRHLPVEDAGAPAGRSSGSSTRLSKRKSLWIRHWPTSAGWCASSQAVTSLQSPRSSVAARREPVGPAGDLARDVPLAAAERRQLRTAGRRRPRAAGPAPPRRARTASTPRRPTARRAGPCAGSCRRAAPSRRSPSRSPTRRGTGRPSARRTGRPAPSARWMRYSRPMSWALCAFAPDRRPAQDQVARRRSSRSGHRSR